MLRSSSSLFAPIFFAARGEKCGSQGVWKVLQVSLSDAMCILLGYRDKNFGWQSFRGVSCHLSFPKYVSS